MEAGAKKKQDRMLRQGTYKKEGTRAKKKTGADVIPGHQGTYKKEGTRAKKKQDRVHFQKFLGFLGDT